MMEPEPGIDGLLSAAKRGEKTAENRLFSLLRARILNLAQRRIKGRDPAWQPDDVVQEVFKVMCAPDEFQGKPKYQTIAPDHFWQWFFTIVRHKIGDRIRKHPDTNLDAVVLELQPSEDDPAREAWDEELKRLIQQVVSQMRAKDRQTIHALILKSQGYDLPDEVASLSQSAWDSRVSRFRKKFRNALKKFDLDL